MKNFPFEFDTLNDFSNSIPYAGIDSNLKDLFHKLNSLKEKYRFPAIENNVGCFISFYLGITKPKVIFEMGSGYGHSAFWYLNSSIDSITNIFLTERREDLAIEFEQLPWPSDFKSRIEYYQGDAFDKLEDIENIDFLLIDGQKSDYEKFLDLVYPKLSTGASVLIDNSFWRGSFLDLDQRSKHSSAQAIFNLHQNIKDSKGFEKIFIPFKDGVSLLRKI